MPKRLVVELTALAVRLEPLYSTPTREFLAAGITVPTLVVLAVWLGLALGVPLVLTLVVATILGLGLVTPFMLNPMPYCIPIEIDETPYTAQTNRAEDAPNYSEDQD